MASGESTPGIVGGAGPGGLGPGEAGRASAWPAVAVALVTGATMMGGQVAWMRLAQTQVGSGLLAGALSLSGAMAGLSLGAGLGARLLLRRAVGGVAVVQQALCAAVLVGSPWLIEWVGSAAVGLIGGRMELAAAQWALAGSVGLLLALLNVPFGMVLPVAVELDVPHRRRHASRRGGLFYAFQSAGAVAGALLLGLLLSAPMGYRVMLALAAVGHLLLLWVLIRQTRRGRGQAEAGPGAAAFSREPLASASRDRATGPRDDGAARRAVRPPRRRGVPGLAMWLGMLGLAGELVWLRGLVFYLQSNVYVYGLTTAVFIGSLTLGGLLGAWLSPLRRRPGQFLAAVVLLIGLLVALSGVPLAWLGELPTGGEGALPGRALTILAAVSVVIAPPTILMGMTFPLLVRLADPARRLEQDRDTGFGSTESADAGRAGQVGWLVGRVAAFNAAGSVLGPLVGFGVLLTVLDARHALLAIAVGYMIAALWAEIIDPATGWGRSRARARGPQSRRLARGPESPGVAIGDPSGGPARPEADGDLPNARTRRQRLNMATRRRIPWVNMALFAAAGAVAAVLGTDFGRKVFGIDEGSIFRSDYLRGEPVRPGGPPVLIDEKAETATVSLKLIESRDAVVAVRRRTDTGVAELLIDRNVQGDDSPPALRVQRFQGLLPLLLAPADHLRRALVVGLGTGSTVAPLVQAGVERVTVAELVEPVSRFALSEFAFANDQLSRKVVQQFEPAPPAAAPSEGATTQPDSGAEHGPARRHPSSSPSQVRILSTDGRTLLRLEPAGWDLILVDIVYPTAPGAADLFSEQFYRLAFDRLGDDGLFVHWLPLWQMRPDDAASVVAAFQYGFRPTDGSDGRALRLGAALFQPLYGRAMVGLIGSRRPLDLTAGRLSARIERLGGTAATRPGGLPGPEDVSLGTPQQVWATLLTEDLLAGWAADARPTTDWFPRTELRTPLGAEGDFARGNVARLLAMGYGGGEYTDRLSGRVNAGADFDRGRMLGLLAGRRSQAEACLLALPGDAHAIHRLLVEAVRADRDDAWAVFQLHMYQYDVRVDAAVERARRDGDLALTLAELDKADAEFPHDPTALWRKADLLHQAGRVDEAIATFETLVGRFPRSADLHYQRARLLLEHCERQLDAGRLDQARRSGEEARVALTAAAGLRSAVPRPYRDLYQAIRARLDEFADPPATRPD